MKDNSGISSRLGSAIQTLLEVRQETQRPFIVATVILEFLSIFKKSQASSPFEALNSACLSRCQRDVPLPVQMRRGPMALSRDSPGDSDVSSSCEISQACIQDTAGKSGLLSSQGILVSIPLEAGNSGSLSHAYC